MKCYTAYKDSGIEWLGDIPKEWSLKKLKYISRVNSLSLSETTKEDYEFNYIDIGNVDIEKGFNLGEKIRFEKAPSRARRIVRKGNTIVSTVRTYLKAIAYIGDDVEDVIVSTGFAVINPNKEIEPKFLYYLLRSEKFIDRICALSVGVSYPAINSSELSSIDAWFPNKDDQNKISAYLDRKAESIEKLIVKKERMIELLKEERKTILNQAITKGLEPKVETKDSGIEWLGKVPKHWKIGKIRFAFSVTSGNGFPDDLQGKSEGKYPFYKVSDINLPGTNVSEANNYVSKEDVLTRRWNVILKGSILLAKIGAALAKNHRKVSLMDCLIDNNMMAVTPSDINGSLKYHYYLMSVIQMEWFSNPGAVPSVDMNRFLSFYIPDIQHDEQKL